MTNDTPPIPTPDVFPDIIPSLGPRPLIACHNDADGLCAGVILQKTLAAAGLHPVVRIVGKGENAYSAAFGQEVRDRHGAGDISGLVIADLGVSSALSVATLPVVIVDHHQPTGFPAGATVISG